MTWHASEEKTDLDEKRSNLAIVARVCLSVRERKSSFSVTGQFFVIFIFSKTKTNTSYMYSSKPKPSENKSGKQ